MTIDCPVRPPIERRSAPRRVGARRSRWAAIGAAIAVSLGAGGVAIVNATSGSSSFVPVTPERILDTRAGLGLEGLFASPTARTLQVTGPVPTASGTRSVVPDGATAVVLNVTAVQPTADGFVSVRPDGTPGPPATSNLNFTAGAIVPNAVTVALPTSGAIDVVFDAFGAAGPTSDLLIDVTGYFVATGGGTGTTGAPGPTGPVGPPGPTGTDAFASDRIRWVDQAGTPDGSNGAFDSVQAAIDSINGATAATPFLVRVGPGTFTGQVDLTTHVHIEGSGRDATILSAPGVTIGNPITQFGAGTVRVAGSVAAEVRDLTIVSEGGPGGPQVSYVAVRIEDASDSLRFRNVAAVANADGSSGSYAWIGRNSSEVLVEVDARATSGSGAARGVYGSSWEATVSRSSFRGDTGTGFSSGARIVVGGPRLEHVSLSASSVSGSSATALSASSSATFEAVGIEAQATGGGGTLSFGINVSGDGTVLTVRDARLSGQTAARARNAGELRLVNTMVDGGVTVEGADTTLTCRELFRPDLSDQTC